MLLLLFSWLLFLLALYWREQASSVSGEAKGGRGIGEAIGLVGLVFRGGRWRRNVFGQVSLLETPGVHLCKIQNYFCRFRVGRKPTMSCT